MTESDKKQDLTLRQQRFLAEVPNAKCLKEAAAAARVSRGTVYTWIKKSKGFQTALQKTQQDIVEKAYESIETALTKAADKLISLVDSPDEKISLRASIALIELYHRHKSSEEIEQRLTIIEKTILPDGQYPPDLRGLGGQSLPGVS